MHLYVCINVQGGEDSQDALSCRSSFAKEPLIIGLFKALPQKSLMISDFFAKRVPSYASAPLYIRSFCGRDLCFVEQPESCLLSGLFHKRASLTRPSTQEPYVETCHSRSLEIMVFFGKPMGRSIMISNRLEIFITKSQSRAFWWKRLRSVTQE